ncbi:NB-ARC domain-containing protein [Streptomyces neyagawaensis]|uniref:NB-ARC domain-containing protein n=1 Tax=Streptomyces neyagawaensis TaxID=42238 RepID=A0ABV3B2R3_9ACTN
MTVWVGIPINMLSDLVPARYSDDLGLWLGVSGAACGALWVIGLQIERLRSSEGAAAPLFDVPAHEYWVPRDELNLLVTAVLRRQPGSAVAITTALHGAGGFGKTTLARALCEDRQIRKRFPGGIAWVTVGQDASAADLAQAIGALTVRLGGANLPTSDLEQAGLHLAHVLEKRPAFLLIVDDVWTETQLRPFLHGGPKCTRLITTRSRKVLPWHVETVEVDQMTSQAASRLLGFRIPGMAPGHRSDLLQLTGRWPLLLSLVNGALRERAEYGEDLDAAAAEVIARLKAAGPTALDVQDVTSRDRAVHATIGYSLDPLGEEVRDRFLELGVFAEDTAIPLTVVASLWAARAGMSGGSTADLCRRLAARSLVRLSGASLELHDVIRDYARAELGPHRLRQVHLSLLDGNRDGLPWWELPADPDYLVRHLAEHLHAAGRRDELAAVVTDPRWVDRRVRLFGPVAAEADLALAGTPLALQLAGALPKIAFLLEPRSPDSVLTSTLLARLYDLVPDAAHALAGYRAELRSPWTRHRWPLPGRPDTRLIRELPGHGCEVTSVAISPQGWVASAAGDGSVRIWELDGSQIAAIDSDRGREDLGLAISPSGDWFLTASEAGTVRFWDRDGRLLGPVAFLDVDRLCFSPDGRWLVLADVYGETAVWRTDGTHVTLPRPETSGVVGLAVIPGLDAFLTLEVSGRVRRWGSDGRLQATLVDHQEHASCNRGYAAGRIRTRSQRRRLGWRLLATPFLAVVLGMGIADRIRVVRRVLTWSGLGVGARLAALTGWLPPLLTSPGMRAGWERSRHEWARPAYWTGTEHVVQAWNPIAVSAEGSLFAVCDNTAGVQIRTIDGAPSGQVTVSADVHRTVRFMPSEQLLPAEVWDPDVHSYPFRLDKPISLADFSACSTPELLLTRDADANVQVHPVGAAGTTPVGQGWQGTRVPPDIVAVDSARNAGAIRNGNRVQLFRLAAADQEQSTAWTAGVRWAVPVDGDRIALFTADGGMQIRSPDGAPVRQLRLDRHDLAHLPLVSPDASWCAGNDSTGGVRLWDGEGRLRRVIPDARTGGVGPGGGWLALLTGSVREPVLILNPDGGERFRLSAPRPTDPESPPPRYDHLLISPQGDWLACWGEDTGIPHWKLAEPLGPVPAAGPVQPGDAAAFSPDGSRLAAWGRRQGVILCERQGDTGDLVPGSAETRRLLFAHDSRWFAHTHIPAERTWEKAVTVIRHPDGRERATLDKALRALTPDGRIVTGADYDSALSFWDADGTLQSTVNTPDGWLADDPVLSPDAALLAAMGNDGTLRIADTHSGDWLTGIRLEGPLTHITWFPDGSGLYGIGPLGLYGIDLVLPRRAVPGVS